MASDRQHICCRPSIRVTRRMVDAGLNAMRGILGGWGRLTIFDEEAVLAIYRAMVQASQSSPQVGKDICSQNDLERGSGLRSKPSKTRNHRPSSSLKRGAWPSLQ